MVVEIDPSAVVSVPYDCECQKLRTSKYKVVAHYETIDAPPLEKELYESGYDDDYADDENEAWFAGYNQAKQDMLDKLKNDGHLDED